MDMFVFFLDNPMAAIRVRKKKKTSDDFDKETIDGVCYDEFSISYGYSLCQFIHSCATK